MGYETYGINEMSVYIDQFKHKSWSNTSSAFKFETKRSFLGYLNSGTEFLDSVDYINRMKNMYEKIFDTKLEFQKEDRTWKDPNINQE
ncbi:hypothetical protein ULMS_08780 [Patiriisocius marinistellae]|uniref:Uncharacterized protein n=1 Tax=Patiriisocius marinistellae TaxID=2494560 RepID=A0A5J4FU81_9FLAO|nr:hypothetical protein [Patiriisocius marinistellae]GEQ85370.1 hypothetical protein ULMS_08780 [Patiriisocius marinistellae]